MLLDDERAAPYHGHVEGIGERLREVRMRRGLSLRDLAGRCGLSASFLSQVERGRSALSIVSLLAICEILQVPVTDLLPNGSPATDGRPASDDNSAQVPKTNPVLRRDECPRITIPNSDVTYQWLSGGGPEHEIEVVCGEFPADHEHPPHAHGGQEFGYLLEGEMVVIIDGLAHPLRPGDSYTIGPGHPHGFRTGAHGARMLWFHTQRFMEWYAASR